MPEPVGNTRKMFRSWDLFETCESVVLRCIDYKIIRNDWQRSEEIADSGCATQTTWWYKPPTSISHSQISLILLSKGSSYWEGFIVTDNLLMSTTLLGPSLRPTRLWFWAYERNVWTVWMEVLDMSHPRGYGWSTRGVRLIHGEFNGQPANIVFAVPIETDGCILSLSEILCQNWLVGSFYWNLPYLLGTTSFPGMRVNELHNDFLADLPLNNDGV